ncbi:preprotein translocase subunit YajC [Caminibacter mediatlanticus TB-2]|uniref:Preprotein translocase subunit YajC n=1 Tax=Caminibacter mediatlanticus TB-2 TaxID=391592 RepID=A0AAI9AH03_9BACT|nr:preprotein translocase subunit YajC [Caminibacter mediatlanticus TB-2]
MENLNKEKILFKIQKIIP